MQSTLLVIAEYLGGIAVGGGIGYLIYTKVIAKKSRSTGIGGGRSGPRDPTNRL